MKHVFFIGMWGSTSCQIIFWQRLIGFENMYFHSVIANELDAANVKFITQLAFNDPEKGFSEYLPLLERMAPLSTIPGQS